MEFFEELPGGNRIHEEPVDWNAALSLIHI